MITRQAIFQFKKMTNKEQKEKAETIKVFSASKTNIITGFSRNGIMMLETVK